MPTHEPDVVGQSLGQLAFVSVAAHTPSPQIAPEGHAVAKSLQQLVVQVATHVHVPPICFLVLPQLPTHDGPLGHAPQSAAQFVQVSPASQFASPQVEPAGQSH